MRINIYAHLIIIEILDEIYAREQTWSTVEYAAAGGAFWCHASHAHTHLAAIVRL